MEDGETADAAPAHRAAADEAAPLSFGIETMPRLYRWG
jgi:hypothetical protein